VSVADVVYAVEEALLSSPEEWQWCQNDDAGWDDAWQHAAPWPLPSVTCSVSSSISLL